ncbi:hypothetical protein ACA910_010454 [Epithemia clementina (nom. ined.)]
MVSHAAITTQRNLVVATLSKVFVTYREACRLARAAVPLVVLVVQVPVHVNLVLLSVTASQTNVFHVEDPVKNAAQAQTATVFAPMMQTFVALPMLQVAWEYARAVEAAVKSVVQEPGILFSASHLSSFVMLSKNVNHADTKAKRAAQAKARVQHRDRALAMTPAFTLACLMAKAADYAKPVEKMVNVVALVLTSVTPSTVHATPLAIAKNAVKRTVRAATGLHVTTSDRMCATSTTAAAPQNVWIAVDLASWRALGTPKAGASLSFWL